MKFSKATTQNSPWLKKCEANDKPHHNKSTFRSKYKENILLKSLRLKNSL